MHKKAGEMMLMMVIFVICVYALFAIRWSVRTFDAKSINQMIYHLVVPCDGTDEGVYKDLLKETVPGTLCLLIIFYICMHYTPLKILYHYQTETILVMIVFTVLVALYVYEIPSYLFQAVQKTNLYERYYHDPHEVQLEFSQKRNLIHIYLESVENTYLSRDLGGQEDENYMEELGELCQENLNFSHNQQIGGAKTIEGTQWTIGSMVGQEAGIPLFIDYSKKYDHLTSYLPGCVSIGEILKKEGYYTELIQGSDADFGCTSNFFRQHGDYVINDYHHLKETGRIPEDYLVFWGFEDKKLFEFAKEDLIGLSKKNQPFYLEMVTIDTHTPDGFVCDECDNRYDRQYANVINCQSHQVAEFVKWCQKQDWYHNTTIVITGDHNSMSKKFFKKLDKDYIRTPYNCFINPVIEAQNNKNRDFAIFDFCPTILASIGVKIKGDRLGLGTNLFSDKQTLMEKIGYRRLNNEVKKRSTYFQKKILGKRP